MNRFFNTSDEIDSFLSRSGKKSLKAKKSIRADRRVVEPKVVQIPHRDHSFWQLSPDGKNIERVYDPAQEPLTSQTHRKNHE